MKKQIFTNEEWKEMMMMQERAEKKRQLAPKKKSRKFELSKGACFLLGVVVAGLVIVLMNIAIDNYNDYLEKCDERNGYTCNVFGR